jgi:RNA polymerase sigma-70 factor (ECF subfamily)
VEPTDRELLARIAAGDRDAMQRFHSRYADRLFRFAVSRLRAHDEAEDAVQETMIAIWANASAYRSASAASTWVFGICRHKLGDALRRRRPTDPPPAVPASVSDRADPSRVEFWEAFSRLTDEQQELILLVFHQGFSQQEVAEVMRVPVGTIKSRTFYARRRLQELLSEGD